MNRLALLILLGLATCAHGGGIYSPDESSFVVEVDATTGQAKPFAYSNFRAIMGTIQAVDNPAGAKRAEYLARIDDRKSRLTTLDAEQFAGLSADLLRMRRSEEAINLLHPASRDRRKAGFVVWSHLTRAHLARNELNEAVEAQTTAVFDYPFPKTFGKLGAAELTWLRKVEKDYFLPLLRARRVEGTSSNVRDTLDPLFRYPPTEKGKPGLAIDFVAEDGQYKLDGIAEAAKAALPDDALAVVQQLLLWMPDDSRLMWLLGELYHAKGDIETAAVIFDECVREPRNYSSPVLMEHRQLLRAEIETRQAIEDARVATEAERVRDRKIYVGLGMGTVIFFLMRYQWREIVRRRERRRARRKFS